MIKEFIGKQKGGKDFLDGMKSTQVSDQRRVKFINYLADYVISIYGAQPSTTNIMNIAIPASDMFPVLLLSPVCHINNSNKSYIKTIFFCYDRQFWLIVIMELEAICTIASDI